MREKLLWEVAFSTSDELPATVQGRGGGKKCNVVHTHPYSFTRVLLILGRTPRLLLQSA